jgi:DamX protein
VQPAAGPPARPGAAPPLGQADSGQAEPPRDEAWVLAQDPGRYTIQLAAGQNRDAAQRFSTVHGLRGQFAVFRTRQQGKDWYVLVYGSFPDRDAASQALENLPPYARTARPWPRSFKSIQDLIRQ